MNDKTAHAALKKINDQRNKIGVGGYKDSRRDKCERHEKFNETMNEMNKISDTEKMK
jgi:hypothetical protein